MSGMPALQPVVATAIKPFDNGWGRGSRPVINVSWEDAKAYVGWLSKQSGKPYRLPTEAEWEYAARAGTTTPFSFGSTITIGRTVPVGTLPANPWGLREVHGNVLEWVEDRYHDSYQGAPQGSSAWTSGQFSERVGRGGSWYGGPRGLRSANREGTDPGIRNSALGFRVARTLTP